MKKVWKNIFKFFLFVSQHLTIATGSSRYGNEDQVIVITSCDSGIGKILAERVANEDDTVVTCCLPNDAATHVSGYSNVKTVIGDLTQPKDLFRLVCEAKHCDNLNEHADRKVSPPTSCL